MKYYLAIDIGASSGRHILGHLEDGKIVLEERSGTALRGCMSYSGKAEID